MNPPDAPRAGSSFTRAYHTVAVDGVILVVISGTIAAVLRLPTFSALWTTDYGSWLYRKLVFVLIALAFGVYHWRRVVTPDWTSDTHRKFSRSALAEFAVGRRDRRAHGHAGFNLNAIMTAVSESKDVWPITFEDVDAAHRRIQSYLSPTPFRRYPRLSALVGHGIDVFVKHENHQPTNSFKIRNGLSFMTALDAESRRRGVVAASTGNHGQGIAFGGQLLGVSVTVCVPAGNNPDKNTAMRALGATVVEEGRDYDDAVARDAADRRRAKGASIAHSTNDPRVVAGAGTMTLEILRQEPSIDALVIATGGGSQAVGAMTVARTLAPHVEVFGVQAAGASAIHDSWHARKRLTTPRADTFAEGVATRTTYDLTFPALQEGLAGFVTVTDAEIAEALRTIVAETHNLVEGAGAMGFAALPKLADRLAGKRVGIVFCGGNMDTALLRRILNREL